MAGLTFIGSSHDSIMHCCSFVCWKPVLLPLGMQQLVHQGNFTMHFHKTHRQRSATLLAFTLCSSFH